MKFSSFRFDESGEKTPGLPRRERRILMRSSPAQGYMCEGEFAPTGAGGE